MSGLLNDLPSCGTLTSARPTSHGTLAPYLAAHDTSAPAEQQIRSDGTHILVRTLQLKKEKEERERKANQGKASAEGGAEQAASKRARLAAELQGEGSLSEAAVKGFTVDKLKSALQSRGLTVGGKKARRPRRMDALVSAQPGSSKRGSCKDLTARPGPATHRRTS